MRVWCRADVALMQANVVQSGVGREWCRVQNEVPGVVQGEHGAGECGAVWCRAWIYKVNSRVHRTFDC